MTSPLPPPPDPEPTEELTEDVPSVHPPGPPSLPPPHLAVLDRQETGYLANLKFDLPASVVVFLVALPLCLGIAVASGAPPFAGLITGIVGGLVVSWASGSSLAVSGPAAGLTVIVLAAIEGLGYEAFLLAVVLAGIMQILFGVAKAGLVAYYFPSSVIKGMLAAIGVVLIGKEIPHALGHDEDYFNLTLIEVWTDPLASITGPFVNIHAGALITAAAGLFVLILWSHVETLRKLKWLPAPLVVVLLGIGLNALFGLVAPSFVMSEEHLVSLPEGGIADLAAQLRFPAFGRILEPVIWQTAFTIAAVASIETLLCLEAIDRLDPYKRISPTNRELVAQGLGNVVSGFIGGLPLTAVIVRGSANIQSGGRTRISAFSHGVLLLLAVIFLPFLINRIPLAALAAVLLHVGYKLARVQIFRHMFRQEAGQWMPFVITVAAVVLTDLLTGVGIGMAVGVFFILRANLKTPYFIHHRDDLGTGKVAFIKLELSENVSFLNKASVNKVLHEMPADSMVEIDGTNSEYIHPDVLELIHEFAETAHTRGIQVFLDDIPDATEALAH